MGGAADEAAQDHRTRAMAHLQSIGVRALASNQRRVSELDDALQAATRGGLSERQRSSAVDTAHQLVGSAGTFGYASVSDAARRLEQFFLDEAADQSSVQAATDELGQIRRGLAEGPDEDLDD